MLILYIENPQYFSILLETMYFIGKYVWESSRVKVLVQDDCKLEYFHI